MHEGYSKVFAALDGTEQQDFVLARAINAAGSGDVLWVPGQNR